jgi:hypothetical protein
MANTVIQIKSSASSGNVPSVLYPGELAINIEDGNLFYGNSSNQAVLFDAVTEPSGLNSEIQFNRMGSFGANQEFTYDESTGTLQVPNIVSANGSIDGYEVGPAITQAIEGYVSAGSYANSAFSKANTAVTSAATADQKAVSAGSYANSAFIRANTAVSNADIATQYAQSAGSYANSAFSKANTAAGANGEIQFNLNGSYGTSSNLYYKSVNNSLYVDTLEALKNVDAQNVIAFNRFYAGIATSLATPLPDLIAQFTGNSQPYVQVNLQNIDPNGSADYVVTGDVGTDETFYITTGIQGSQLEQGLLYPLDGYLIVQGNTSQLGGNLVIGTISETPGLKTRIVNGGYETGNLVAEFSDDEVYFVPEIRSNTTIRIYNHANSAFNSGNTAYIHANAAYAFANTLTASSIDSFARTTANSAYNQANTATTNAATADQKAVSAGSYANSAFGVANTASVNAISAGSYANSAYAQANIANTNAITAGSYANGAFARANTANTHSISAYNQANTATTNAATADQKAVSSGVYANAAFAQANTGVSNAVSASSYANSAFNQANTSNTNAITASSYANSAFVRANTANTHSISAYAQANIATTNAATADQKAVSAGSYANSSFGVANTASVNAISAGSFANSAFAQANTANLHSISAYAQANIATTNAASASTYANSAFTQANTATTNAATADQKAVTSGSYANSAYTHANTAVSNAASASSYANGAFSRANTAQTHANAGYNQANTATTNASTADQKAVSAGVYANAAFAVANSKLSSSGGTISGNLQISGNLSVLGNVVSYSAEDFIVNDPIVLLANNNTSNIIDIGFIAHYQENGNVLHTGLIKDVSANTWYLIDNYLPHIQENNILDPNDASLVIATLKANVVSTSILVRGYDVVNHTNSAYSQANTATTNAATADQKAVSAGSYANAAFGVANTASVNATSAGSYANGAFVRANTAVSNAATADQRAVTSGVYANAAYTQANTAVSNAASASSYANGAFVRANTAVTNAATADQRAVTSGVYANAAFAKANTIPTQVNATDDSSTTTLYPIMVGAAGSTQTIKSSTSKIYFNASTGTIFASSKSFSIPHPLKQDKRLVYGSLEGPENGVYVRGRTQENIIELPDYWVELVDADTITVNLTPIGKHQKLYVEKIEGNKVYVFNDSLLTNSIDCYFTIYGERKDIDKLEVEQ